MNNVFTYHKSPSTPSEARNLLESMLASKSDLKMEDLKMYEAMMKGSEQFLEAVKDLLTVHHPALNQSISFYRVGRRIAYQGGTLRQYLKDVVENIEDFLEELEEHKRNIINASNPLITAFPITFNSVEELELRMEIHNRAKKEKALRMLGLLEDFENNKSTEPTDEEIARKIVHRYRLDVIAGDIKKGETVDLFDYVDEQLSQEPATVINMSRRDSIVEKVIKLVRAE